MFSRNNVFLSNAIDSSFNSFIAVFISLLLIGSLRASFDKRNASVFSEFGTSINISEVSMIKGICLSLNFVFIERLRVLPRMLEKYQCNLDT